MKNFEDFILNRASKTGRRDSNCAGTALYLVGEIDSDEYLSRINSKEIISKMKQSRSPEQGYLAVWEHFGIIYHAGVIMGKNPFHIVHRKEKDNLLVDDILEEFSEIVFKEMGIKPSYRIPNKLLGNKLK